MSEGARVHSIDILLSLAADLGGFAQWTDENLAAVEHEIRLIVAQLQDRVHEAARRVDCWESRIEELAYGQDDPAEDEANADALAHAEARLAEAEEHLSLCRSRLARVEEGAEEYRAEARILERVVSEGLGQASLFLRGHHAHLERYVAIRGSGAVGSGAARSSAAGEAGVSGAGAPGEAPHQAGGPSDRLALYPNPDANPPAGYEGVPAAMDNLAHAMAPQAWYHNLGWAEPPVLVANEEGVAGMADWGPPDGTGQITIRKAEADSLGKFLTDRRADRGVRESLATHVHEVLHMIARGHRVPFAQAPDPIAAWSLEEAACHYLTEAFYDDVAQWLHLDRLSPDFRRVPGESGSIYHNMGEPLRILAEAAAPGSAPREAIWRWTRGEASYERRFDLIARDLILAHGGRLEGMTSEELDPVREACRIYAVDMARGRANIGYVNEVARLAVRLAGRKAGGRTGTQG